MKVWHVYGRVVPDGELAGCWTTVVIELAAPQEMPYGWRGIPYLATFDHEPSEDEMEALRDEHDPIVG